MQDAMAVARNVMFEPKLLPGGGASEMAVSMGLLQRSKGIEGVLQFPYKALADALQVIPRTLVRFLTYERSKTVVEMQSRL